MSVATNGLLYNMTPCLGPNGDICSFNIIQTSSCCATGATYFYSEHDNDKYY